MLAHCWTSDHDAWRYQLRDLRTWFGDAVRVIGYDHRGHGASDECPQEAATIENLGRDLAAVIDACTAGDLVLAGHSIGGMTVMALAEHRPDIRRPGPRGAVRGHLGRLAGPGPAQSAPARRDPRRAGHRSGSPPCSPPSRMLSRRQRRQAPVLEAMVARRFLFGDDMRLRDHALAVEGSSTPRPRRCAASSRT